MPHRNCCPKCNCTQFALDNIKVSGDKNFEVGGLGYNFLATSSTQTLLVVKPKHTSSEEKNTFSNCNCKEIPPKTKTTPRKISGKESGYKHKSKKSSPFKTHEKFTCCSKCNCKESQLKNKIAPKDSGDKEFGLDELRYDIKAKGSTQTLLSSKPVRHNHICSSNCDCPTPLLEIKSKRDYSEIHKEFEQRFANQPPAQMRRPSLPLTKYCPKCNCKNTLDMSFGVSDKSFSAGNSPRKESRGIMKVQCCKKCNCKLSTLITNTNSTRDYMDKDFETVSAIYTSPDATQTARSHKTYQGVSDEKSSSSSYISNKKKEFVSFKRIDYK